MKLTTNYLKAIFLALFSVLAIASCDADNDDKVISFKDLPKEAQNTINESFNSLTISTVTRDRGLDKDYEVLFSNGTKVEFDRKGVWTEVSCTQDTIPSKIVPSQISSYIAENYASQSIVKIEKDDRGGYEVKLSNGIEIEFNKSFKVTKIDR